MGIKNKGIMRSHRIDIKRASFTSKIALRDLLKSLGERIYENTGAFDPGSNRQVLRFNLDSEKWYSVLYESSDTADISLKKFLEKYREPKYSIKKIYET